jgi:peptidoglycan/LPS O-acetylase OafA/YrhL
MAVMLVLLEHFVFQNTKGLNIGNAGVDLFFVLSGFLITGILLNQQGSFFSRYKTFMGRRILRIFPLYYLFVFLLWILGVPEVQASLFYLLTYTYNIAIVTESLPRSLIIHFWSLSVEEQFYVCLPFIVMALQPKIRWLKLFMILMVAFCGSLLLFEWSQFFKPFTYYGFIPRAYALTLGGLAALWLKQNEGKNLKFSMWTDCLIILLGLLFMTVQWRSSYVVFPLLSALLIVKLATGNLSVPIVNRILNNRLCVHVGKISYGVYLFHLPLAVLISKKWMYPYFWYPIENSNNTFLNFLFNHKWLVHFPLYTLLTIGVAHLSYTYFEKPILQLKDRFFRYAD